MQGPEGNKGVRAIVRKSRVPRATPRLVFLSIFAACAGLIGFAIYLQEQMGLDPCAMCILQRYAFVAIGGVALAAGLHGPRRGAALKIYALLLVLFALIGGGTAIRQSYLQHNPPKSQSCGTELEFLLENFPLSQALPKIFAGSGDCSVVKWKFLGLSIPEWALVWFVIFVLATAWVAFVRKAE
jgi:protein dithiol:quinone oxidoreductase